MPGDLASRAVPGSSFRVAWVGQTASTQADVAALARAGEAAGLVVVADHQTAGRGRRGRTWEAPPGASLLASILLRPPADRAGHVTMAVAVAAAEAVAALAGVQPRIKWPNDLVFPGDGTAADRKLAGILAEADWAGGEVAVVAGIGVNVSWPDPLPAELAGLATAVNHISGVDLDRRALLEELLRRLEGWLAATVPELLARWRELSATLGRRVRIELAEGTIEGHAADFTDEGHLLVDLDGGGRRTFAAGDVVHLRPTS